MRGFLRDIALFLHEYSLIKSQRVLCTLGESSNYIYMDRFKFKPSMERKYKILKFPSLVVSKNS